jgi:hypothetical protein
LARQLTLAEFDIANIQASTSNDQQLAASEVLCELASCSSAIIKQSVPINLDARPIPANAIASRSREGTRHCAESHQTFQLGGQSRRTGQRRAGPICVKMCTANQPRLRLLFNDPFFCIFDPHSLKIHLKYNYVYIL